LQRQAVIQPRLRTRAFYSITSSARASSVGGTSRPSAFGPRNKAMLYGLVRASAQRGRADARGGAPSPTCVRSVMDEPHVGCPSRIARCEVRYDREKVLLVERRYGLDHQRAPFSVSGAMTEVIELPKHVAG